MKTIKALGLLGLAVSACFAAQAFATPVAPPTNAGSCPVAPANGGQQTYPGPVCLAPYGSDGVDTGLGTILGPGGTTSPNGKATSIFSKGSPGLNPWTDQVTPSAYWKIGASGGSENAVNITLTGNAPSNSFGIFDPSNPSNMVQIFGQGEALAGYTASLGQSQNGLNWTVTVKNSSGVQVGSTVTTPLWGNLFGYYLSVPDNGTIFYSDSKLNADYSSPDHGNHMIAYLPGTGNSLPGVGNLGPRPFLSDEYLLAWEDTPWAMKSDLDYNDFIVTVESVTPVPEPADLAVFGFGILLIGGFVALRRRRLDA